MSDRKRRKLAQREANRMKRRLIGKVLASSKASNSVFNLNFMAEGWLELESDPGTFSLLLEDFGCHGAQVDEIYDLEQKFDSPVLGFIFLFKWLHNQPNERRSQKANALNSTSNCLDESTDNVLEKQWSYVTDEETISQIFFAKQTISNSCATHALISILLNCDYEKLNLGPALTRLKEHTHIMNPENKGYAIGNLPELARAHNSHASYSSLYSREASANHSGSGMSYMLSGNTRTNLQQNKNHDSYHFVSYVPIEGKLYELDGLKDYPIDHGPPESGEDWTEKFRRVIKQRIQDNKLLSNEIRYNLMAVVPDKREILELKLNTLKRNNKAIEVATKMNSCPRSSQEIPAPPYSPLSNGTLTSSEIGSLCNSPNSPYGNSDDCDKYFLVKFDQRLSNLLEDDNQEAAHKNSMIDLPTSSGSPLDLSKKEDSIVPEKQDDSSAKPDVDKPKVDDEETKQIHNNKQFVSNPIVGTPVIVQTFRDGATHKVDEAKIPNDVIAHADNKYNLSEEPPFDFNIIDKLYHVHSAKPILRELQTISERLVGDIKKTELLLNEEVDKRLKFKIDNSRRTHNYEPFIMTFLTMLAKHGKLADLIEKDLGIITDNPPSTTELNPITESPLKAQVCPQPSTSSKQPIIVPPQEHTSSKKRLGRPPKIRPPTEVERPVIVKPVIHLPKYKGYVKTGRPVGRPRKNIQTVSGDEPQRTS